MSAGAPVDLTTCDREPIHIPGAIQPHGLLLVLREPDLVITTGTAMGGVTPRLTLGVVHSARALGLVAAGDVFHRALDRRHLRGALRPRRAL